MSISRLKFFKYNYLAQLDSTQNFLRSRLFDEDLPEGYLLHTSFQSGGKGQGTNKWESAAGENLLFSFVLRPVRWEVARQFYISMLVSLALADTLAYYLPEEQIHIKWPNDIYVDNKKIAGVLIENSVVGNAFEWILAGVGLNVNQQKFYSDAPNPVSIAAIRGEKLNIMEVLEQFERQFIPLYSRLLNGEAENIKEVYLRKLYRKGRWHKFKSSAGEFHGKIIGVDAFGFLQMETEKGIQVFDVKEVEYLG